MAFLSDSHRLVSGAWDKQVKIWDLPTGRVLAAWTNQTEAVQGVAVSPDGQKFASACWDGSIRIRSSVTHEEIGAIVARDTGVKSAMLDNDHYTTRQKFGMIGKVAPFVTILAGVMVVLYAGWATPSETAGVGAVLAILVIGAMYGILKPSKLMPIVTGTLRESTMLLMIIGATVGVLVVVWLERKISAAAQQTLTSKWQP